MLMVLPKTVVELFAGNAPVLTSNALKAVKRGKARYVGIDASADSLNLIMGQIKTLANDRRFAEAVKQKRVVLIKANLRYEIPLPAASADVIHMHAPTYNVFKVTRLGEPLLGPAPRGTCFKNSESFLKEVRRVLKPGGRFLLSVVKRDAAEMNFLDENALRSAAEKLGLSVSSESIKILRRPASFRGKKFLVPNLSRVASDAPIDFFLKLKKPLKKQR